MEDVRSTTLLGNIAFKPSITCIESRELNPINVIMNISKGKNASTK